MAAAPAMASGPSAAKIAASMFSAPSEACHVDFTPGSIKKMVLTNFMTHQYLEFVPSSRVNFLLGANGSGKSSIVCALCLGLGGKTQNMERGKTLGAFVQTGKSSATIEITIAGTAALKGDVCIKREFVIPPGKDCTTKWFVNDEESSEKQVHALLATFHIQMDNLCMFLPQERVGKFSTMAPTELLKVTMRSVGKGLEEQFEKLLQIQDDQITSSDRLAKKTTEFEEVAKELKTQTRNKENAIEYQNKTARKDLLDKRIPVGVLEVKRADLAKAEADLASIKEEGSTLESSLEAPRNAVADAKAAKAGLKAKKDEASLNRVKAMGAVGATTKAVKDLKSVIADARSDIDSLRKGAEERAKELDKLTARLQETETLIEKLPPIKTVEAQAVELDKERAYAAQQVQAFDEKRDALDTTLLASKLHQLQKKLKTTMDSSINKRKILGASAFGPARTAFEARQWIDERRELFNADIYGPLLLEMELKERSPALAAQIENSIPVWVKYGFVASNEHDKAILAKQRFRGNTSVSVMEVRPETIKTYLSAIEHRMTPFQLSELGRKISPKCRCSFGDELVTCPPAVMVAVCRESKLHDNLFLHGGNFAAQFASLEDSAVPTTVAVNTEAASFRTKESSYGGFTSTSRVAARGQSDFLHINSTAIDTSGLEREIAEVQAAIGKSEDECRKLDQQSAEVRKILHTVQQKLDKAKEQRKQLLALQGKRNNLREKLSELSATTEDNSKTEKQIKVRVAALRKHQIQLLKVISDEMPNVMAELVRAHRAELGVTLSFSAAERQLSLREADLKTAQALAKTYQKRLEEAAKIKEAAEDEVDKASAKVKEAIKSVPKALLPDFVALPEKFDEIKAALCEVEAELKMMTFDAGDLKLYRDIEDRHARVSKELEEISEAAKRLNSEVESKTDAWMTRMEVTISSINTRFREYMAKLNVVGAIQLDMQADKLAEAGIKIMVSFRKGEALQALNKDIQSGGERAVSTMMYLLSLQAVTPLPFRVVDEINQGMDIHNERAVIEVLQHISDLGETSGGGDDAFGRQLFMISPKLLPDLVHTKSIRTSIVFNGKDIASSEKGAAEIGKYFLNFSKYGTTSKSKVNPLSLIKPLPKPQENNSSAAPTATAGNKRAASDKPAPSASKRARVDSDSEE